MAPRWTAAMWLALLATGCGSSGSLQCDPCASTDECPATKTCRLGYCVSGDDDPRRCPPRGSGAGATTASSASSSSGASGSGGTSSTSGASSSGSGSGASSSSSGGTGGTFGLTTVAGSAVYCERDKVRVSPYALTRAGATVHAVVAYLDGRGPHDGGAQPVRGVVYAMDDAGEPSALVCATEDLDIASDAGPAWIALPVDGGCALAPGGYFLGIHTGTPGSVVRYYHASGAGYVGYDLFADGADAQFLIADAGATNNQLVIYATYSY